MNVSAGTLALVAACSIAAFMGVLEVVLDLSGHAPDPTVTDAFRTSVSAALIAIAAFRVKASLNGGPK